MKRRFSTSKFLFLLLGILLIPSLIFFVISWVGEYRPKDIEIYPAADTATPLVSDTLSILIWNIGYAGLGDDMDFFYDGGTQVRDTRERTVSNLNRILSVLQRVDADIMLLQEVDSGSRRTYQISEVNSLRSTFPHHNLAFAYNYNVRWVPIPPSQPMGQVRSGLVTLSRAVPASIIRYQYSSAFPFPVRLFNLKRGLLATEFIMADGQKLVIGNTHNTAYDTGDMRQQEIEYLRELLGTYQIEGKISIIGGDWNQFPPGYTPAPAELSNPDFVPQPIPDTIFDSRWGFVYDRASHSLRFLDKPYDPKTSVTTLTDFFLVSEGVEVLSIETLQENFHASDHNPVVIRVVIHPFRQSQN